MYVFMKMLHLILLFLFLGVDYRTHTVDIDGKRIMLQLCDTIDEERLIEADYWFYYGVSVSWGVVRVWSIL